MTSSDEMTGDALDQQTTLAWQSYAEHIALRAEIERLSAKPDYPHEEIAALRARIAELEGALEKIAIRQARREALEEAAQVVEHQIGWTGQTRQTNRGRSQPPSVRG